MSEIVDISVGIIQEEITISAVNNIGEITVNAVSNNEDINITANTNLIEININTAPITIINPQSYDLSEFKNLSSNPFVRQNTLSSYVPISRTLTINGTTLNLSSDRSWNVGTVTSVGINVPTGFTVSDPITTSGLLTLGFASGYSLPTTSSQSNWESAYNNMIVSGTVTGTTTKTLTLTQQDGGTIVTSWSDFDTAPVTSVFGRLGDITAELGDYSTTLVTEGTNLYFTESRARESLSSSATGLSYNTSTGVFSLTSGYSIPTTANQSNWTTAYNRSIVSASVNYGAFVTSLVLNQQNTGTITASLVAGTPIQGKFVFFNGSNLAYTSIGASAPLSFDPNSYIFSISQAGASTNGYLSTADWNTFNNKQNAITLTTTGNSGSATFASDTLNIPTYTLSGLGGTPSTRRLEINGTSYDLSTDRSWSVGTVTSIGISVPTGLTVSNTPITTNGVIAIGLNSDYSIPTIADQSNWSTAYSWGDHALEGYLTVETDPIFSASPAFGITNTNITNWNTAYSWGNHATQNYATKTYVDTAVNNLVDSAPGTLDTLNELAAALGDDPNFATTVATSIGTKVPLTRTLTINGTAYDLSADRSWTITDSYIQSVQLDGTLLRFGGVNSAFHGNIDLSALGYLTSFTETDPTVPAHVKSITTTEKANWNTAYSWGNHASVGYLTSFTETDPTVPSHVKGITTTNISNWDTAFSWGDHAVEGYATESWVQAQGYLTAETDSQILSWSASDLGLTISNGNTITLTGLATETYVNSQGFLTSFTETDPTVPSHVKGITTTNISNWNTAFGWGNHASVGYLTSFTETDPTVPSHVKGITTTNISNWNLAYSWGDHSTRGYATQTYVNTAISNLVDSAPTTLDTLNELAAALGDDPNFATTITTLIGTKQNQLSGTGFVKVTGTTVSYDNSTYLTTSAAASTYALIGHTHPISDISGLQTALDGKFDDPTGTTAQYIDGTGALQTFPTTLPSQFVKHQVKAGVAINKGQAVYVTSADGTNMIVGLASNASESTSSKTMGLLDATVAANDFANVVTEGLLAGLNTSGANAGDPVWLGTDGNLIFGLTNKPYAPRHLVFIGIVTRVNANNGEIFVKVQNGFELNEIHDVDLKTSTPTTGQLLRRDSDGLWKNWTPNYLTSFTETDPIYTSSSWYSTTNNSSNWNTAYGWGDHSTRGYATTSYVNTQISNLINGAPGALDTLDELAAALGDDANFASTVTNNIATKLPLSGGTMSGTIVLASISGTDQVVENTYGNYLHLGGWGVDRTHSSAVLVNTAYRSDYADSLFDMRISRFTNDTGYITGYTETDTLASVTSRGATTGTLATFNGGITLGQGQSFSLAGWGEGHRMYTYDVTGAGNGQTRWVFECADDFTYNQGWEFRSRRYDAAEATRFYIPGDGSTPLVGNSPIWHSGNLTNLNQLINGPGYITSSGSISGNAATATYATSATRLYASDAPYRYTDSNPYYLYMNYDGGNYWELKVSPSTPGTVRVAYANNAGNADTLDTYHETAFVRLSPNSSTPTNGMFAIGTAGGRNFIQSHAGRPLDINPEGNAVTVGSDINVSGTITSSVAVVARGSEGREVQTYIPSSYTTGDLVSGHEYGWYDDHWRLGMTRSSATPGADFVIQWNGSRRLSLTNSGDLTISGTFTEQSARRFKENIKPLESSLDKVNNLNPVTYNKIGSEDLEIGLIAEEVAELFPEVVTYTEDGQTLGIQYQRLSVILLKAVQDLTARIEKLENK